jgi:hypothetical protein
VAGLESPNGLGARPEFWLSPETSSKKSENFRRALGLPEPPKGFWVSSGERFQVRSRARLRGDRSHLSIVSVENHLMLLNYSAFEPLLSSPQNHPCPGDLCVSAYSWNGILVSVVSEATGISMGYAFLTDPPCDDCRADWWRIGLNFW